MTRVAAIGGYQAKVTLVRGELALDGAERSDDTWRLIPVEPAQPVMEALNEVLSHMEPALSALQLLLNEKLGGHD